MANTIMGKTDDSTRVQKLIDTIHKCNPQKAMAKTDGCLELRFKEY